MKNLRFAATKEDRVALITGGARGLGRAIALRLAFEGRDIAIVDLREEDAACTVREIEATGVKAIFITTDVTDVDAVRACVESVYQQFSRIDILVCSAGVLGLEAPFMEQSSAQFDQLMKVNVYGT